MPARLEGQILRLLGDGKFHTAAQIATALCVSRSAVLQALGEPSVRLPVFRVRGRGYRIAHGFDVLRADSIKKGLADSALAPLVEVAAKLESTNAYLMAQAAAGAPHGSSVFAEFQTRGRGRRGRSWQMGWGEGLAFSLLWRFEQGAAALSGLSLAVGVALIRGLENFDASGIALKWPNDLLYADRKLGGILVELSGDVDGPCAAVIGVGINIRAPGNVDQRVACLLETGLEAVDRNLLAANLLLALESTLNTFTRDGFAALRDEWLARHAYPHDAIRIVAGTNVTSGQFEGLCDDGALLLRTADGVQRFVVGDVSLRAERSQNGLVE